MAFGWQDFETADYVECDECHTAWDTEAQAWQCAFEDRQAREDEERYLASVAQVTA